MLFHSDFGTTSSSGSASERLPALQHGRSTFPDQLSGDKDTGSHSSGEPVTPIKLCTSTPCFSRMLLLVLCSVSLWVSTCVYVSVSLLLCVSCLLSIYFSRVVPCFLFSVAVSIMCSSLCSSVYLSCLLCVCRFASSMLAAAFVFSLCCCVYSVCVMLLLYCVCLSFLSSASASVPVLYSRVLLIDVILLSSLHVPYLCCFL
eukprot:SAG11_NODE_2904_length_2845_cov_13.583333_1_plen_201_part_10